MSLAREGVNVVINSRTRATLDQAAYEVAAVATGRVDTVCVDITTPEGRLAALNTNMLTPIELIKATVDSMVERWFGRIVNITSAAVKAPISFLGLSNGARAGLTGFVAGVTRQVAVHNVTVNSILPGRFDTDRMRSGVRFNSEKSGVDFTDLFEQGKQNIPVARYGDPAEFGELCAYLCSDQVVYVSAQNLVTDGGAYPGTL